MAGSVAGSMATLPTGAPIKRAIEKTPAELAHEEVMRKRVRPGLPHSPRPNPASCAFRRLPFFTARHPSYQPAILCLSSSSRPGLLCLSSYFRSDLLCVLRFLDHSKRSGSKRLPASRTRRKSPSLTATSRTSRSTTTFHVYGRGGTHACTLHCTHGLETHTPTACCNFFSHRSDQANVPPPRHAISL